MIDTFVILNRKPNFVIKVFIYHLIFLTGMVIFGINTFSYQKYFLIHSQIFNLNSYYYLEVLVPVKEVNKVTTQNTLWIGSRKYYYKVYKLDQEVTYQNNNNYIKVYLEVLHLDHEYQINGYRLDVKIWDKKIKLIELLLNKKENENE